jgi:putative tricarboxylic transport membrane protein
MQPKTTNRAAVGQAIAELTMAIFLMALGSLVIFDSVRVGTGWADDGPRSGYFPFYIGCFLLGSASVVFISTLFKWRQHQAQIFVTRAQFKLVLAVFVPMLVYVGLIPILGLYLASVLLMVYFMRQHGRYGWVRTLAVSTLVQVLLFWMFERWFLVLLPKGFFA